MKGPGHSFLHGGVQAGERRPLGGVIAIKDAAIRNILMHAVDSIIIIEGARAAGPGKVTP